MDLTPYFGALRRRWWWLALGVIVAVVGIALNDVRETPVYQSSTRLLVSQASASGPNAAASAQTAQQLAKTYSELIKSRPVLEATVTQLHLPTTPEGLGVRTQVSIVPDTPIIQVTVSDSDPKRAALTVNGLVHSFAQNIQGDQQVSDRRISQQASLGEINTNITRLQGQIKDTSNSLNQLRSALDAYAATNAEIQQLSDQLIRDRQESLQIRQQRDDLATRLFQLRTQPSSTSDAEAQRLSSEIQQYDVDLQATDQRIIAARDRLNTLRALPRPSSTTADAQRLQDELNQYQDQYRKLSDTQQSILLGNDLNGASFTVTEPANVPTVAAKPRLKQDILLAMILGLLLSLGVVVSLAHFDDRLQEPDEFRRRFHMTPLGTLGMVRHGRARVIADDETHDALAHMDALRLLRANLAAEIRRTPFALCVTSADDREGKSTIAANLAILEAQTGRRVILVDANLRDPRLHQIFGLTNDRGVSTLLADPACDVGSDLQEGPQGVTVLTSGPSPTDPSALLGSPRMVALIEDLRARADLIIFDTSAVLHVPDMLLFHQHTDGSVLVVDMQHTGTKTLERLFAAIESASMHVVGAVLNKSTQSADASSHRFPLIGLFSGRRRPTSHRQILKTSVGVPEDGFSDVRIGAMHE